MLSIKIGQYDYAPDSIIGLGSDTVLFSSHFTQRVTAAEMKPIRTQWLQFRSLCHQALLGQAAGTATAGGPKPPKPPVARRGRGTAKAKTAGIAN